MNARHRSNGHDRGNSGILSVLFAATVIAGSAWARAQVHAAAQSSVQKRARLPVYPLAKSANGRYLVDRDGYPFLIAGDAPQSLMVNISTADAEMYFANRESHGFNALWINLLCSTYTAGSPDCSTYDGLIPFDGFLPGHAGDPLYYDMTTLDAAYFARTDEMIRLAAQHNLCVFLDPCETGSFLPANGGGDAPVSGRY